MRFFLSQSIQVLIYVVGFHRKLFFGDKPDINYDIFFINPIYWIPFYLCIREIDRGHEKPKICFNLSDFFV